MQPQSSIDWEKGVTVQVLAKHPQISTCFRWVHNLLEQEPTTLARYDYQPKPAGWGNGGGGLELDDLERLAQLFPNHPILTDSSLTEEQRLIIAGGIREFVHETGLKDLTIRTDYPGVFLYDYKYKDWVDKNGVVYPGGHRKITLWGELTSFVRYPDFHTEKNEVDDSAWFNLSVSLFKPFTNCFDYPDRPYWSHVRATLIGILRIYRHLRSIDPYIEDIRDRIHQSYWSVIQVGRGDPRFPAEGYKPSPKEWYNVFDAMVKNRMEYVDTDFFVKLLGSKLDRAKRMEEEGFESSESENRSPICEVKNTTKVIEGSEDSEGILTLEEMRRLEDEEYCRWLEESLPEGKRVIGPVA